MGYHKIRAISRVAAKFIVTDEDWKKKWERTTWRLMRKMTLEARLAVVCVQNLYVIGTFSLIWVYKLVIPYWVVRKFEGNGWSWFKTLGMVNVYAPTCHLEYMLLVVTEERSSTCKSSGKQGIVCRDLDCTWTVRDMNMNWKIYRNDKFKRRLR